MRLLTIGYHGNKGWSGVSLNDAIKLADPKNFLFGANRLYLHSSKTAKLQLFKVTIGCNACNHSCNFFLEKSTQSPNVSRYQCWKTPKYGMPPTLLVTPRQIPPHNLTYFTLCNKRKNTCVDWNVSQQTLTKVVVVVVVVECFTTSYYRRIWMSYKAKNSDKTVIKTLTLSIIVYYLH